MKYASLKSETVKVFEIPACNKGVDLINSPESIEDGCLASCKNVCFKDGRLVRRQGISAKETIASDIFEFSKAGKYRLTDTTVFYENEYYKIATADVEYEDSGYFVYVYLIGDGGKVKNIGYMHFQRSSEDTFHIPYKCLFYVGNPVSGGGIFALVSLYNRENTSQTTEKIYEIGTDFNSWFQNYNYYIPTVYINGRGNSYELAKAASVVSTAAPTVLEPLNVLDGAFYCYYTSDGYSYDFKLPFMNLAEESIICRIYRDPSSYAECIIYADTDYGDTILMGVNIRIRVDRQKGIVNFSKGDSNYAVPQMANYSENNIRILAKKEIKDGFKSIVSADNCAASGERIFLASGNKIYSATYDRPLYFPQSFSNSVGSPYEPITALVPVDDEIYAFKENKIYSVKASRGKNLNKISLLIDNETYFYKEDTYDVTCVDSEFGSRKKENIAVVNGELIFLADTGGVFSVSSNKIKNISKKIKSFFDELSESEKQMLLCGVANGFYIISVGNKAMITDCKDGITSNAWYYFEFPNELNIIGIDSKNNLLLCLNKENVCFTAIFDGQEDNIIVGDISNGKMQSNEIEAEFKTKSFDFGSLSGKKKVSRIYLQLDAKDNVLLKVGDDETFADFEITNADFLYKKRKCVKLITNLKGLRNISLQLKTNFDFALEKGEIYYNDCSSSKR